MTTALKHLIFIDDDFPTNRYHEIVLEEAGYTQEGRFFTSPLDALKYFTTLAEDKRPQLPECIFLDINMPMYNGFELLDRLLALPFDSFPPVIMLTTSNNPTDIDKINRYEVIQELFQKPLTEEILHKVLGAPEA